MRSSSIRTIRRAELSKAAFEAVIEFGLRGTTLDKVGEIAGVSKYERLWAIVVANFFDTIFNRRVCQAWVSLISEVPHNKQCQRIQIACNERNQSNLKHEIKYFLTESEAILASKHLGVLIDGLWVRAGLLSSNVSSSNAISEMEYAINKLLPNDAISIEKHKAARNKIETVASISLSSKAFREQTLKVVNS